jgi:RNA polymerase sigma factor (sigma-70 family)
MRTYAAKLNRKSDTISIDELSDNAVYTEENPEKIYVNKEFFSELWDIVDSQLSNLERQAFEQVIQGNTYDESAENLGISPKSVANAVHRARGKIRCGLNKNQ